MEPLERNLRVWTARHPDPDSPHARDVRYLLEVLDEERTKNAAVVAVAEERLLLLVDFEATIARLRTENCELRTAIIEGVA